MCISRPARVPATVAALLLITGCSQHRPTPPQIQLMQDEQAYNQNLQAQADQRAERLVTRLEHEHEDVAAGRAPPPPTVDVLILSGGGEYGAFGAGFLKGWGTITDPAHARPEFDVVTGVSTGALISPFAFVGDTRSYDHILRLYETPQSDWAVPRGPLFFLPGNPSLLNIDGLQKELEREVDMELVRSIADAAKKGRMLCVGSSNLDYGKQRIFDLGVEAEKAVQSGDLSRLHQMLLASCAIPGVFPPRIIDGRMYVDGGVTANILYNPNMTAPDSALALWRKKYPDRPIPRQRIWVIIDEQFQSPPQVVQPGWVDVAGAAVELMIRAGTHTALRQLADEAALIRATTGAEIEVRYVAIPDDFRGSESGIFNKKTMDDLAKLGIKMGADPSSWKTFDTTAARRPAEQAHMRS